MPVPFDHFINIFRLIVSHESYDGTVALAKGHGKILQVVKKLSALGMRTHEDNFTRRMFTYIANHYTEYDSAPSMALCQDHTFRKSDNSHALYLEGKKGPLSEDIYPTEEITICWLQISPYFFPYQQTLHTPDDVNSLLDKLLEAIRRDLILGGYTAFLEDTHSTLEPKALEKFTNTLQQAKKDASHSVWEHTEGKDEAYARYYAAWMKRKIPLFTGLQSVDKVVNGFAAGDMVSVLGATGHGKSALVGQWAYAALMSGLNGIYITMEMEVDAVSARFHALHSGQPKFKVDHAPVSPKSILKYCFADEDAVPFVFDRVIPDFNQLPGKLKVVRPSGRFTTDELEALLSQIDDDPANPYHYFVLDHPGWIDPPDRKGAASYQNTDDIYRQLRRICMDHKGTGILGLMPVQANRTGIQAAYKNEGVYTLEGIGQSSEIGKSSTHVFFISSFEEMRDNNECLIGCLKDRDGSRHKHFRGQIDPVTGSLTEPPPGQYNVDFSGFLL